MEDKRKRYNIKCRILDNILPVLLSWESGLFGRGLLHSSSERNTREGRLHSSKPMGLLQDELADFGVGHLLDFVHRLAIVDALDGFVDDAVANGQHGLVGEGVSHPGNELLGAALEAFEALDVVGPLLHGLQVGNELSGEAAPVALPKQGRRDNGLAMRLGNDLASLDGTVKITGYEGVNVYVFHLVAYGPGLFLARLIEFSGCLSLKDLCFVGHGLAVTY